MKVKNNHTTHIGFGEMRLLPGESIDVSKLPRGYGLDNPAVKFYINKGWLTVTGANSGAVKPQSVNVSTKLPGDDNGVGDKMHLDPEQFDGWETEQIFRLAADMGIELSDASERDDIIAKIAAVEVGVGEYSDLNPEDYNSADDNPANDVKDTPATQKAIGRMNLDELKALAVEMKLEVAEIATKAMLIEKIKAAKKTEE